MTSWSHFIFISKLPTSPLFLSSKCIHPPTQSLIFCQKCRSEFPFLPELPTPFIFLSHTKHKAINTKLTIVGSLRPPCGFFVQTRGSHRHSTVLVHRTSRRNSTHAPAASLFSRGHRNRHPENLKPSVCSFTSTLV